MSTINHALPTAIPGVIRASFLSSDLDGWRTGRMIGVSTYPGETLALSVLLDGPGPEAGSLFVYLPLHAFAIQPVENPLHYTQLAWADCPGGSVEVSVLAPLNGRVQVLCPHHGWETGRYVATLDWWEHNTMAHLVQLDQGQLAVMPNHKIKFGDAAPAVLPTFEKLRGTWTVGHRSAG